MSKQIELIAKATVFTAAGRHTPGTRFTVATDAEADELVSRNYATYTPIVPKATTPDPKGNTSAKGK